MSVRLRVAVTVAVAALVFGIEPGWGTEVRSGNVVSVPAGSALPDDLYAFGQSVSIGGSVSGDLLAAGGEVSLSGSTTQDAVLAGGRVDVAGSVGDDLRTAGGDVRISGSVADNASVAGGTVILSNTGRVGRDLQVVGGTVRIEGDVGRSLDVFGGQASLDGKVGGDVQAKVGRLTVGPGAVIQGDLVYTSAQKASIAPGARVQGKTVYHPAPKREKRAVSPVSKGALWVLSFLAIFLIGVVFIALAPRGSETAADRVSGAPWVSLLVGFILLVVVPVAVFFVTVTLVGIPLALILLVSYVIMIYVSRVFVGLAIGRWIFRKLGRPQMSLYVDLLVGLLILWLLSAIPYVGWVVRLAAVLLGLGALASQRYSLMRELRAEGKI